jgi:single-strand DNA-binding protein
MNKLFIVGNLTKDPETRTTPNGDTVCNFSVAVNRRNRDRNECDFFRVNAWKKLGETCQSYLAKGRKVAVTGEVRSDTYQTPTGEFRAQMVINADEVEFLSPKAAAKENGFVEVADEKLPF